jgi:hypothetical protein
MTRRWFLRALAATAAALGIPVGTAGLETFTTAQIARLAVRHIAIR